MVGNGRRSTLIATLLVAGVAGLLSSSPAAAQPDITVGGLEELRNIRQAIFGGLRNQIGTLPIPTGGAFTYDFDPGTGVFTRTTDTLGPIFADRAETIGRGKVTLTTNLTYHSYDELDDVSLDSGKLQTVTTVATPGNVRVALRSIREQVTAEVYTLGGTYGVTDRIDVSLTLPIVRVRINEQVNRIGFRDCNVTFTVCSRFTSQDVPSQPGSAENSGIGDIDLRAKWNFLQLRDVMGGRLGLAASLNVKAPTGDSGDQARFERGQAILGPNQLVTETRFELGDPPTGTGIFRFKPQIIASGGWFGVEPHANVGLELGETTGVTNDFVYAVGVDYAPHPAVTIAAGVLGRYSLDVKRRKAEGQLGEAGLNQRIDDLRNGVQRVPGTADAHIVNATVGIKVNLFDTVVAILNVLIPVNGGNLRDDLTPTLGVEWTF